MKRILYLEDDEFLRDLTVEKLTQADFEVIITESGEEALAKIHENAADLLLLDIELQGMQGTEVLARMHQNGDTKNVPVIVFSNKDEAETREECTRNGSAGFFLKVNTNLDELVQEIRNVLATTQ